MKLQNTTSKYYPMLGRYLEIPNILYGSIPWDIELLDIWGYVKYKDFNI
jgi:hypothetical protein